MKEITENVLVERKKIEVRKREIIHPVKTRKSLSRRRMKSDWVHGNIEPQSIYVRSKLILIFGKRIQ